MPISLKTFENGLVREVDILTCPLIRVMFNGKIESARDSRRAEMFYPTITVSRHLEHARLAVMVGDQLQCGLPGIADPVRSMLWHIGAGVDELLTVQEWVEQAISCWGKL